MKKLLILLLVLSPIVSLAQRKPKIKGSRIVTEVSEELPPFNALVLNDDLEIVLEKSFGPGYRVIADDNLIDVLKFEVVDGTLVISSYYNITAKKQLDITVNYTELEAISLKNGSIGTKDVIDADELFIDGFNNSKMDIKVKAGVMDINLEDTSKGDFNVEVDSLNLSLNKRAEAYVYAQIDTGSLELEGNSSLSMEGTSDTMQATILDYSKYKGESMEIGSFQLKISGNTSARTYAFRDVDIAASGNASIYLYGTPHITIQEFLDTAQLIKKE
ncbi:GIN domain-containing protein [Flagellimonas lutimaris]|uniref:GIN domain-containing protein n=1 Tax=Flagellimonas lutimaris TaxID=475082 RepID=UPI003F5CCB61